MAITYPWILICSNWIDMVIVESYFFLYSHINRTTTDYDMASNVEANSNRLFNYDAFILDDSQNINYRDSHDLHDHYDFHDFHSYEISDSTNSKSSLSFKVSCDGDGGALQVQLILKFNLL